MSKKLVCLDFDGVIHQYDGVWRGEDVITGGLVEGTQEAIATLQEDFSLTVFSSRCSTEAGRNAIEKFLKDHELNLSVSKNKPAAYVYLDDRGVKFNGNWKETIMDIKNFKWWLEKDNSPEKIKFRFLG